MPYPIGSRAAMKNIVLITFINLLFLCFFHISFPNGSYAQQDWKQEYATVCAKTQKAMNLSSKELRDYVDRCDKLQERINELNGSKGASEKKVYTKLLKMCSDLYKYVLDYKNKEE
jgi:hypothetical protein